MARSLRDELLRAGLVTSEQAARAERGGRSLAKPAGGKADRRTAGGRAAKRATNRRPRDVSKQRPLGPAPSEPPIHASHAPDPCLPSLDPEARVKQLNLEIRRILDTGAEKIEAETDTPFHFARGDRVKRLYVSEDQRRRLVAGELAIVGFRGRHHLVPRPAGERVRELRREVFVFIAGGDDGADRVEEGYEGYEVPDELRW